MRTNELDAYDGCFYAPEGEKEQRIKNVKNTQPFVIDGGHPFVEFLHERAAAHLGLGPCD
jgi:hypothetical protein